MNFLLLIRRWKMNPKKGPTLKRLESIEEEDSQRQSRAVVWKHWSLTILPVWQEIDNGNLPTATEW